MARSHTQEVEHVETSTVAPMTLKWRDGTEFDFYALPLISQRRFVEYGVRQLQDDKAVSAFTKAKKHIAGEGGKSSEVTNEQVKNWRESDEENETLFESWRQGFMQEVKDAALAGELTLPSERGDSLSQVQRDRREAARLTIIDHYAILNAARKEKGEKPATDFYDIKKGKKGVATENAERKAWNDERITKFLENERMMTKYADVFARHLAEIINARKAKAEAAKVQVVEAADLTSDIDDIDDAAE